MKGIYILLIWISMNIHVSIGALGPMKIEKGLYAYVGSAQRNLEKRVARHLLRDAKRNFWHIDFLLNNKDVEVLLALCKEAERSEECRVAKELGRSNIPVKSFGSSDCRCVGHLFKIVNRNFLIDFMITPSCIIMTDRCTCSSGT